MPPVAAIASVFSTLSPPRSNGLSAARFSFSRMLMPKTVLLSGGAREAGVVEKREEPLRLEQVALRPGFRERQLLEDRRSGPAAPGPAPPPPPPPPPRPPSP